MKTSPVIKKQRTVAFFAGSFDPFTRGHESIVLRALHLFDEVIIAIGVNPSKHEWMPVEERVRLIETAFAHEPRVRVVTYDGLTVKAAQHHKANFLLRGVRTTQDFEYEKQLAEVNRDLSGLETVLLYTLPEDAHVSSTMVRDLAGHGQNVAQYLPRGVNLNKNNYDGEDNE